jgi:thymidylate synthase ThyX
MRSFTVRILPLALAALVLTPILAQQPGGRFGGFGGGMSSAQLVQQKSVQEELKLSEDQVSKVQKASESVREKYKDDLAKIRESKDFAKMGELFRKIGEDTDKELANILKPDQTKRLKQIRLQLLGLRALQQEDVAKELKLTDKQKDEIKALSEDLAKDTRELMKDAFKDAKKREEAQAKIKELNTETLDKVLKSFSADQKKAWSELTGPKFEGKIENRGFGPGGFGKDKGKGKGKGKDV